MARKVDGVIEAVRYTAEGRLALVRVYERRGATYSDRLLLSRAELLLRLKAGKQYVTGERQRLLASTFKIVADLRLMGAAGAEVIVAGQAETGKYDHLQGAPLF
jgi:hypothetical protein